MLPTIFEHFVEQSPVSVMLRGLMERIFVPHRLDRLFHEYAQLQYERELLFSSVVELMSLVVCSIYPSVYAAYRAQSSIVPVSASALYEKLNGIEPQVTAALLGQCIESEQFWSLRLKLKLSEDCNGLFCSLQE